MQTDPPLITALIPTHRRPYLLRRAIRSVLNQTYPHLRVWVYDNASGDETGEVVAALARQDSRVHYVCHPENIGLSANFASAMESVDTPYFSILSDDDCYYPTFYETAMAGFVRHPDAMFSAAATILVHTNGNAFIGLPQDGYFTPPEGFLVWTQAPAPAVTSMVFRREVIQSVGLMDQDLIHADVDYLWRITSRFPFVTSARPGLIFYLHAQQGTRQTLMESVPRSYRVLRERVRTTPNVPAQIKEETMRFLRMWFSRPILIGGLTATHDGDYARAERAAAILSAQFDQKSRATVVKLLARTCARVPPLRWPVRTLVGAALQLGTTVYQSERRDRASDLLRAEIKEFVHNASALSAP